MAERQIFRRRRRRWGRWAALGLVAALVIAWFNGPWIVERILIAGLSRAGLEASLDVRRVGFFETVVEKVRIATPPMVSVERMTLRYTPIAALRSHLYAAIFDGAQIEGGIAESAMALVRLEAALRRYESLRIQNVEFAEAKVRLDVDGTLWKLTLRGLIALQGNGGFSGPVSVVATSPGGAFGGEVRLAPDQEGRTAARLDVREAVLRLPGITLEQITGHVGVGHGPGPLPAIDVDLSMGGHRPDKSGLERARLRLVADGPTAIASLAGIDLAGRRFTVESAFDVARGGDGLALRLTRPGSIAFLDVPRRGAMPLGMDARILPGDQPAFRIEPTGTGMRLTHALRLQTRMTTIASPLGPMRMEPADFAIDGRIDGAGARGAAIAQGVTAHLADWAAIVEGATLVARWDEGPLRIEADLPHLASTAAPAAFSPLHGSVSATSADGGFRIEGTLADRTGQAAVALAGLHRADGTGSLRLSAKPVRFGRGGADLAALSPAAGTRVGDFRGEVTANAEIAWSGGRYESRGRVLLRDVAATLPVGRAQRVNGVVALDGLWPPSTPGPQTLSIGAFDVGVPLSAGQVSLAIEGGRPILSDVRFGLFGGTITLGGPARIDLDAGHADVPLAARGVDLAAAARGLGMEGLAIDGTVDGAIPLKVVDGKATIDGAAFRSTGPGRLAYRPGAAVPDQIARIGPGLPAMLEALADYRYDDLRLGLAPGADGRPRLHVDVHGSRAGSDRTQAFRVDLDGRGDRHAPEIEAGPIPEAIERLMKTFE